MLMNPLSIPVEDNTKSESVAHMEGMHYNRNIERSFFFKKKYSPKSMKKLSNVNIFFDYKILNIFLLNDTVR